MLFACWSVKGGSGTTVVAAALAVVLGRRRHDGVLLVDLGGDLPATLGVDEPQGPGVAEWLAAGRDVPADALGRIEVDVAPGVRLLPRGRAPWLAGERADVLAGLLTAESRQVVVDCGTLPLVAPPDVPLVVAAAARHSVLVTRPCYLALRRAQQAPLRPSRVVVVREPGRALDAADVVSVLGVPLAAEVLCDPVVARAVDAGLLADRVPRGLELALRGAA